MWLDKKVCLKGNSDDEDHEQKFKVTKLAETDKLRKSQKAYHTKMHF